jgi:hypothetical protein
MTKRIVGCWAAALLFGLMALPTSAQPQGGFDPAAFRQRMNDRIREVLGATDEEYQALQPKVEKVMDLQRQTRGGGMGMMFRGGGPGGPGGAAGGPPPAGDPNRTPTPVQEKAQDLQKTLENKDAKPEEIKAKLAALRDAREKAKSDLAGAQKELRELLTQRQEAAMVMMGFLD